MQDYPRLSASSIVGGLKKREFSAVEICREALNAARNTGEKLNTFITITEDKALRQAAGIDRKIAEGAEPGPISGVPIAIKDNICYKDYPTSCASHILDGFISPYDATCVKRLLDSGGIIIGKTNMDEFAMGSSNENSHYGPALNPAGENLVPGGSSGGSAAAVSAGIVPIAFGSDTGGSIRQPAAFCGVLGLKPTYGTVSRYGLVAFASSMDQIGPFARNSQDLALAYTVICGRDENDSTSVDYSCPQYSQLLEADRKFKIGLPKEYYFEELDSDISRMIEKSIERLGSEGHNFVQVSLPHSPLAIAVYYVIADAEASSNLARYDGVRFGLREKDDNLTAMYGKTRSRGFGREVKRRITIGTYVLSAGYYEAYYNKALQVRELICRDFEDVFDDVDLLLTPTTPTAAFKMGEKINDPLAMYLSDVFTTPANLAGIPAISIPFGVTGDNRPIGLQFMAPAFQELSLFQIAARLEHLMS